MRKAIIVLIGLLTTSAVRSADLLEIYDLARQNDPRLLESEARRNAALENRPQAIANLLPQINASYEVNTSNQDPPVLITNAPPNPNFTAEAISLDLNLAVIRPAFWVQLAQSDHQIAQAEADYQAEAQNLMLRTAEAYFEVLFAEDDLRFARAEKEAIGRQLAQAQERFKVGLSAITDVNEAQAAYDQAKASEIAAENALEDAKEAVREIVGDVQDSFAGLKPRLPLHPPAPNSIEEWSTTGLLNNARIVSVQQQALFSEKQIKREFSGHLPTVDVFARYSFDDSDRIVGPQAALFGTQREAQTAGLRLEIPVFAGGSVNSRTRQARSEYAASLQVLDRQRRAVIRQVKDAFRGVVSSIAQVQALEAAVKSSQSALESTTAGMEVGTRTLVDVLTEQRDLYQSERDLARARYDYLLNGFRLKEGAGTLSRNDLEQANTWLQTSRAAPAGSVINVGRPRKPAPPSTAPKNPQKKRDTPPKP